MGEKVYSEVRFTIFIDLRGCTARWRAKNGDDDVNVDDIVTNLDGYD